MIQAAYECNGAPVSAERFYALACNPQRSVAVEACAGAGKTWMLVSRMLRAMLESGAGEADIVKPQEILAITFTKRAAGEMRERLYEWLAEFAHADTPKLVTELRRRGVTGLDDAAVAERMAGQLQGLYARLLATGRSVQIRTFHGWFAALLRSAPVAVLQSLRLPVNYELLEDDSQARSLVWRRFYAALVAAPELRADFEAVVLAYGRSQADKALKAALDKRVEFALADADGVPERSVEPFGAQFPAFAGLEFPEQVLEQEAASKVLWAAARALGRATQKSFSAKGAELERALTDRNVEDMVLALLTADGKPRKFNDSVVDIEAVRIAQDLAVDLAVARHQHTAWLYQQRMLRLTRRLIEEFTALKQERGWIDMNDVERAALAMLGDPVLSGWVQEKLDARIRHLLIDEFQDTNPLQWQALLAWLGSYAGAGQAPSVFIVGDPKQSIYRFRRAEPQVFRAAQTFVRSGLGGDLLSCDHTRRNAVQVITTVNAAMSRAVLTDAYEGFRPHSTDSERAGEFGSLPVIPRSKTDPEEEAEEEGREGQSRWRDSLNEPREVPEETLRTLEARQAAAWISALVKPSATSEKVPLQPSQIMVLSRKRAGLLPLQEALSACGIPALIGENTALIECCEVLDIVALMDVLVSVQHDLSLARVLRSPIFGLDSADLVALALAKRRLKLSWFALLQQNASEPIDELLAVPTLGQIAPTLARWQAWLATLPPHDALQAIYDDGDLLARFAAAVPQAQRSAVLANLRALLAVALQVGGGRYITPYALVRALKAGGIQAPATLSDNAVRLLTIHGAKGLEAEAVLLLDTDTPNRAADSMGVLVDWPGEESVPRRFAFLVSEGRPPACCAAALEAEKAARHREELNALYVALTRARHTLAISAIEPHRSADGSWWKRLSGLAQPWAVTDGVANEAQEPVEDRASSGSTGPASSVQAAAKLIKLAVLPPAPPRADVDVCAADSTASRTGQAMHRLLEWGGWSERQVRAVVREFKLDDAQAQTALAGARRILAGQGAWAWDASVVSWQGNEVALAYEGQSLRLDRLVQRRDAGHEGHWWVLDYKSGAAPQGVPELREQMQIYCAAVRAIHAGQVVKAAFLTANGDLIELD